MVYSEHKRDPFKYWFRHEWDPVDPAKKRHRQKGITDPGDEAILPTLSGTRGGGGTDKVNGINKQMGWVELETGEIIDGWHAARIRDFAMDTFKGFLEESRAPFQWKNDASPSLKNEFNRKIEAEFPELRWCQSHWKADLVAIRLYPNFKSQHLSQIEAQFVRGDENASMASTGIAQKRSGVIDLVGHVKRRRIDNAKYGIVHPLCVFMSLFCSCFNILTQGTEHFHPTLTSPGKIEYYLDFLRQYIRLEQSSLQMHCCSR